MTWPFGDACQGNTTIWMWLKYTISVWCFGRLGLQRRYGAFGPPSPNWYLRCNYCNYSYMSFCAKSASISMIDFLVDIVASKQYFQVKSFRSSLSLFVPSFRFFSTLSKHDITIFVIISHGNRSLTSYCFGIRTFLKQYSCYERWYIDHQYLAQYRKIINNLQEIPLIFCNYAVRSCETWRKGPGQSPCNECLVDFRFRAILARTGQFRRNWAWKRSS